jgi:predicted DNA-binding transcriptional regulator YafY
VLETSTRLLSLLSLLQSRSHWSGAELAERLEVGPRTVRRDVDRLRRLGYPIDGAPGVDGGYRLAAGTSLPPLLLDDEEAVAIAVGLRTAVSDGVAGIGETSVRALSKLEQLLPERVRRARARARRRNRSLSGVRAGGRPRGAAGDRHRMPRPRAAALRLSQPRR